MSGQISQLKTKSTWDKMVHASFRKVVSFDLLFMGLGILTGMGLGVAIVRGDLSNLISKLIVG